MGAKLDDTQIERVKQVFLECGKVRETARRLSLPESTIRPYCKRDDEFAQVRAEKRTALIGTIAEELATVQRLYLAHLQEPAVIAATSAKDSMIVVGTSIDKEQLITGKPTERTEHTNGDDARAAVAGKLTLLADRRTERADRESERVGG